MMSGSQPTVREPEGRTDNNSRAGSLRRRVLRAGGWATAGFILDKLLAGAQLAILARLLTPADFGLMAASAAVLLTLMTLSELGVEPALVTRKEPGPEDLSVAWTISLGRGLVLALCVWGLAPSVAGFFHAPQLASLVRVHALVLLLQAAQSPALALLLRDLDLGRRVRLDLIRRGVEAVATIALAVWLRSAWALLYGQVIGFAVGCLLSHRVAPAPLRLSLDMGSLRHFLRFGKYVNATTVLIFCVITGAEFVVGRLLGTATLGLYQIAMTIPLLVGTRLTLVMNQVSLPTYVLLKRDRPALVRGFSLQLAMGGLVLVPLAGLLVLAAPGVIRVLAGAQWAAAAEPLRVLSLFMVCSGLSTIMGSLQYGLGRPDYQTRIWLPHAVVFLLFVVPMTTAWGLTGMAWALSLTSLLGFGLHLYYTARLLGPEAWSAFGVLGRAAWPVLVSLALWPALKDAPLGSGPAWLPAVALTSGGIAYGLYLWKVEGPRLIELWHGARCPDVHG